MTDETEIILQRWYPWPLDRVWRAWTDPARLDRWWGPDGFTTTTHRHELRIGGEWVYTMAHSEQGTFGNAIRFEVIEPERRLAYAHTGDGGVAFAVDVRFEAAGTGSLVHMRSTFPNTEALRLVVERYGALEGGRQHLGRLADLLGRTPRVRVAAVTVSLDGFVAGPDQSLEEPLGRGGRELHGWLFPTQTFQAQVLGRSGGSIGPDDDFAARSFEDLGANVMGRNMFGPVRGPWPDDSWRGWWGEDPPYHTPVFVLTHHAREPLEMDGGTTFHFVTEGIEAAVARAREVAGERDVRINGGASTVRQALAAGLVDEVHLAVSPVVLGRGESLLAGVDLRSLGFSVTEHVATERATHVVLQRSSG